MLRWPESDAIVARLNSEIHRTSERAKWERAVRESGATVD
jgi:hypothetical protein